MRYTATFLIGLGSMSIGAAAHAQSSITLYGIADAGIAYIKNVQGTNGANVSQLVRFSSGNYSSDRWGLRGTEDLGGDLQALFQLESGFNIGTGTLNQGGREFGRKAIVGLKSGSLGMVTLGRQYDPLVDMVQPVTGDGYVGAAPTPGDIDNYDNSMRISNSVKYTSPTYRGFTYAVIYAFGGTPGSVGDGQTYSAAASYLNGQLAVAGGYFYANGGRAATNGVRTWGGSADTLFNTVVNVGFGSARSTQIARIAARYTIDPVTFGVSYSNVQYGRDNLSTFSETEKINSAGVFVSYRITPGSKAGVAYSYTRSSGVTSASYNQISFSYDYAFSKRTSLYFIAGYQKASGTTLNSTGQVVAANASIASYGANSGANTQGLTVAGVIHRF